jgi:hypothetical protein
MKFYIYIFFENLSRKFNFSFLSDKNNGYILDHMWLSSVWNEQCVRQQLLRKSVTFFLENLAVF